MENRNEQEKFWAESYAENYIKKNKSFDQTLGERAWRLMLGKAEGINCLLECGCNIGRNIGFLQSVLPAAKKSIIEISKPAFDEVTSKYKLDASFNGSILEAVFPEKYFDLVFTQGVLIHIHPDNLLATMQKMYALSSKYILMGEYFNRTPTMLEYQGGQNRLFKRDFGRMFIDNFNVKLVDYGFLWDYEYAKGGFDDITWWLLEKN